MPVTLPESAVTFTGIRSQRENENKARAAARAAAQKEAEQAHADYLASRPATVEIMRGDGVNFLAEFAHWTRAGYEMSGDNLHSTGFGVWHATLTAPAAPAAKGGK
jgi:plastocyanin